MKLGRIKVSDNKRCLIDENGKTFFWMADTAWELIHRLNKKEILHFLETRRKQKFNIIQTVILAELDGLQTPNANNDLPLKDNDPTKPNESYFRYVDFVIEAAYKKGLYLGLLPTWGDKLTKMWGVGPVIFNEENAFFYGEFLGKRYKDFTNILWILGGDRPAIHENIDYRPIWRAMATGLDKGSNRKVFKSYHPCGGHSSSEWLQNEDWLDMNMIQSGHGAGRDFPTWGMITKDLSLEPKKPTLDGETNYEDHPVNPWPKWESKNGYFRDHDVRKQLYRSVFAGGCGVTYGHHHVWQMYDTNRNVCNNGDEFIPWYKAIQRPASWQVRYLRSLMESFDISKRIPDQSLIPFNSEKNDEHCRAMRDEDGRWAMIYLPLPLPVTVDLSKLNSNKIKVSWFNPVTGKKTEEGIIKNEIKTFTPSGEVPDRVLILESL